MSYEDQEVTHIIRLVSCERCGEVAYDCKGYPASLRIDSKPDGRISMEIPDGFAVQWSTKHDEWYTILCEDCLEKPCPDCQGGKFRRYCPTCKTWREQGWKCLDCETATTECPTCKGKNFIRKKQLPKKGRTE